MGKATASAMMEVITSSESVDYFTPPAIIALARRVLGGIDLDPASCAQANETVGAPRYFTVEQDGLLQDWRAGEPSATRVWCNPPYGDAVAAWAERVHRAYATGEIAAALLLVPARVDTRWWHRLREHPVCFISGRLRFHSPTGVAEGGAPFPAAIVHLGRDTRGFAEVFGRLGLIYRPVIGRPRANRGDAEQGLLPLVREAAPTDPACVGRGGS